MFKMILKMTLILLVFSACVSKEYIYLKPKAYVFVVPKKIEPLKVQVKNSFVKVEVNTYTQYIKLLRNKINNLVGQIKDYEAEQKGEQK